MADHGFARGRQPIILAIFTKNCMELKNIGPRQGHIPSTPLDPQMQQASTSGFVKYQ